MVPTTAKPIAADSGTPWIKLNTNPAKSIAHNRIHQTDTRCAKSATTAKPPAGQNVTNTASNDNARPNSANPKYAIPDATDVNTGNFRLRTGGASAGNSNDDMDGPGRGRTGTATEREWIGSGAGTDRKPDGRRGRSISTPHRAILRRSRAIPPIAKSAFPSPVRSRLPPAEARRNDAAGTGARRSSSD